MLALVDPDPRFHCSYLTAADEFVAEGRPHFANLLTWPAEEGFAGVDFTRSRLESAVEFAAFIAFLVSRREEDAPRPAAFVPYTELWMTDGDDRYVGRISLRHRLDERLLTWGGHIGYCVRPSARRRGYATQALAAVLPVCAARGLDPVLVTCDVDNEASRRTIERNGGVYEDTWSGKLRYWVATRSGGRADLLRDQQAVAHRQQDR